MARRKRKPPTESGREPEPAARGVRSMWSGAITFGLVRVPVQLVAATRPQRVSLKLIGPAGKPLRREYYCPEDGQALDADDLVRGYPLADGTVVPIEDDELDALAPDRSRAIDLERFVPADQLPPRLLDRGYFLVPDGEAARAYLLLAQAMEDTGRVGIATFVMRGKQYLVAILAEGGILRAETLRFADELRTAEDLGLETGSADREATRALRKAIRDGWSDDWLSPLREDRTHDRLRALIERKRAGGRDVLPGADVTGESAARADVIDLMEYLKRSLAGDSDEAEPPARARKKEGRGGKNELAALSKQDLYERAKRANIPGRSSMNKDELIAALEAR